MGFRFRRSKKVAPGVRLNISSKSAGVSIGGKAAGVSFNSKYGARLRAKTPIKGVTYSTKLGGKKKKETKTGEKSSASSNIICLLIGIALIIAGVVIKGLIGGIMIVIGIICIKVAIDDMRA